MVTLIQPGLADGTLGHEVEVGCIHGQTETYPTNRITVQTQKGTFTVQAGVVLYLPMPLLIGRDRPIFGRLLKAELRTPQPRRLRIGPRRLRSRPVYMAAQPRRRVPSEDLQEGRDTNHMPHPRTPFGEEMEQLVVPRTYVSRSQSPPSPLQGPGGTPSHHQGRGRQHAAGGGHRGVPQRLVQPCSSGTQARRDL